MMFWDVAAFDIYTVGNQRLYVICHLDSLKMVFPKGFCCFPLNRVTEIIALIDFSVSFRRSWFVKSVFIFVGIYILFHVRVVNREYL